MEKSYQSFVTKLQKWFRNCQLSMASMEPPREWCLLGAEHLTQAALADLFDTSDLDEEIVDAFNNKTQQPVSFKKAELAHIYSLHKCMVARHKSRLMYYRDDLANKQYHTWKATSVATGKFLAAKDRSEAV